jgi:hypothetical protein
MTCFSVRCRSGARTQSHAQSGLSEHSRTGSTSETSVCADSRLTALQDHALRLRVSVGPRSRYRERPTAVFQAGLARWQHHNGRTSRSCPRRTWRVPGERLQALPASAHGWQPAPTGRPPCWCPRPPAYQRRSRSFHQAELTAAPAPPPVWLVCPQALQGCRPRRAHHRKNRGRRLGDLFIVAFAVAS